MKTRKPNKRYYRPVTLNLDKDFRDLIATLNKEASKLEVRASHYCKLILSSAVNRGINIEEAKKIFEKRRMK